MSVLTAHQIHLVGIKGVAMTSLAQILTDAGKRITGADVAEQFVTKDALASLHCEVQTGFMESLPDGTDAVVYTAAHSGQFNPQVAQAKKLGIPTYSQAEALAAFVNQKKSIAICGVGGKSTTSAMLAWIFEKLELNPSYSVGVGSIPGLERTGKWSQESEYFITEADEYVIDPSAPSRGEEITPRFSFLNPFITVCTRISYDHPDVYRDFAHTLSIYAAFFKKLPPEGCLITAADQSELNLTSPAKVHLSYGRETADVSLAPHDIPGKNSGTVTIKNQSIELELGIPGTHNLENATAALAVCHFLQIDVVKAAQTLSTFRSTQRRFEFRGEHKGVVYYDDYAHHPREIAAAISALNAWLPKHTKHIAFQPHTFSRTKQLFSEFVESFERAESIVLLDIFASAREGFDPSITSEDLASAIHKRFPITNIRVLHTVDELAAYCRALPENSALLTLGAGDIYAVHDILETHV